MASELSEWLNTTSKDVAAAMHDGDRPPFAADVDDGARLDYYEARLFRPDGTPNEQNRQQEIQRVGVEGYSRVLLALNKRRGPPGLMPMPMQPAAEEATSYG